MMNVFTLLILSCISLLNLHSQTIDDIFMQANNAYKTGDYQEAMMLYNKISNKNAPIYYNLGNCAYKLEQYGYAMLYWRRAEKSWNIFQNGSVNHSELMDNITLLKQKLSPLERKQSTALKIKSALTTWIRSIPLIILQIFFLILWIFLFLYIRFLYRKQKKCIISLLFSLIAFFGIILAMRYNFDAKTYGIIVSKKAPLLSGPAKTFQQLMELDEAQETLITKETDQYYKITVKKRIGWINKKYIEKI